MKSTPCLIMQYNSWMYNTTKFHGDSNDMTSMPCLIMQYKPYIVVQSCMVVSYTCSLLCVKKQQRHMNSTVFI